MAPPLPTFISNQFLGENEFKRLVSNDFTGQSIQNLADLFVLDFSKLKLLAQHKNIDFMKLVKLREFYKELLFKNDKTCISIKSTKIKIGLESLDFILNEISPQSVVEIVGPTCTGKSRLALSVAVESAMNKNTVLFIDTDLSCSRSKISQMIKNKNKNCSQIEIDSICSSIQVFTVFTMESLINLIELISQDDSLSDSVLIIDSLTTILFANNYFNNNQENKQDFYKKKIRVLFEFAEILKQVSHRSNLITVVTRLSSDVAKLSSKGDVNSNLVISLRKNEITGNIIASVTSTLLNHNKKHLTDLVIDLNCFTSS